MPVKERSSRKGDSGGNGGGHGSSGSGARGTGRGRGAPARGDADSLLEVDNPDDVDLGEAGPGGPGPHGADLYRHRKPPPGFRRASVVRPDRARWPKPDEIGRGREPEPPPNRPPSASRG